MGVELLTERYQSQIAGVLSCFDRIIIQGTLPKWCYAQGMTDYFYGASGYLVASGARSRPPQWK